MFTFPFVLFYTSTKHVPEPQININVLLLETRTRLRLWYLCIQTPVNCDAAYLCIFLEPCDCIHDRNLWQELYNHANVPIMQMFHDLRGVSMTGSRIHDPTKLNIKWMIVNKFESPFLSSQQKCLKPKKATVKIYLKAPNTWTTF